MSTLKRYYLLTKPGIIYGNSLPVIAGFFLASRGSFNLFLFFATLVGIGLVMASGCVFNNYIDRNIDEKMERTKKRSLVTKKIPVKNALIFGSLLGVLGCYFLYSFTNVLTTVIACVGFFFYVVMYSVWKRKSSFGTIVGSVSGAVPPVVGYTAVTNHFDLGALLLFLMLVIWQMPHFYAIAIFRMKEYAAARIPVLPLERGIPITKIHMVVYIFAFIVVTALFSVYGYTGSIFLISIIILGLVWLGLAIRGFNATNTIPWARQLFFFSLIVLLAVSFLLSIDHFLPTI